MKGCAIEIIVSGCVKARFSGCQNALSHMTVSAKLPRLQPCLSIWHLRRVKGSLRRPKARPRPGSDAANFMPDLLTRPENSVS